MHARIAFFRVAEGGNVDAAAKGFDDFIPTVRQMDGSKGVLLLIDRSKGKVTTITLWDSEESLTSTTQQADSVRQQAASAGGLTIQGVEHYEVVRDVRR